MRIFISHSSKHKSSAEDLCEQLPDFLEFWKDDHRIPSGSNIAEYIQTSMENECDLCLVLLDKDSSASSWVDREIKWAKEIEIKIGRPFIIFIIMDKNVTIPDAVMESLYIENKYGDGKANIKRLAYDVHMGIFQLLSNTAKNSLGPIPSPRSALEFSYSGHDTIECHNKMYSHKDLLFKVENFTSIVYSGPYKHPETCHINGAPASEKDVVNSFRALHPEYLPNGKGWSDIDHIEQISRKSLSLFKLQHGNRLFYFPSIRNQSQPLVIAAIEMLNSRPSRSYISLHHPDIDLYDSPYPVPGMCGVQFVKSEDSSLEIIAHFRDIELSFWWCVNSYELIELQKWAINISSQNLTPGKIIIQSSTASWRSDPRAIFDPDIDTMEFESIYGLCYSAYYGNKSSIAKIQSMLAEKSRSISDLNLTPGGLPDIYHIFQALINCHTDSDNIDRFSKSSSHINDSLKILNNAERENNISRVNALAMRARAELISAGRQLSPKHVTPS